MDNIPEEGLLRRVIVKSLRKLLGKGMRQNAEGTVDVALARSSNLRINQNGEIETMFGSTIQVVAGSPNHAEVNFDTETIYKDSRGYLASRPSKVDRVLLDRRVKLVGDPPTAHAASHQAGGTDQISLSIVDLNDVGSVTGVGDVVVLQSNATLDTPVISTFDQANHDHRSSSGGGQLDASAIGSGILSESFGGTGFSGQAPNMLVSGDTVDQVFMSNLSGGGLLNILAASSAYFVYLCRTVDQLIVAHVGLEVTTIGAGVQTAEIGLFSSPSAPNGANQSLTKIESTGTVDALSGTGLKRNTSAFTTAISPGTYLWAGFRVNMTITQPTCLGVQYDMGGGQVLVTAGAAALTGAGPWAGVVPSSSVAFVAPDLRATFF